MDAFASERGDNVMAFFKESFEERIIDTPESKVEIPAIQEQIDVKSYMNSHNQDNIFDDIGNKITSNDNQLDANITFNIFDVEYDTDDNGIIYSIDGELVPNTAYTLDGAIYYTDDNGDIYRIDNELQPNTEYEINGYRYKTDELGRIVSAEGMLKMKDPGYERNMEKVRDYDNQEYRNTDDRGHLIAHQFGGSDRLENLIPQDSKINQVDFRNFECDLANEVKGGKDVTVEVEPIYEGESTRPIAIVVSYSIDGEDSVRVFPNGQED